MKTYYHGTVSLYLPSIEKDGLHVVGSNRYRAFGLDPIFHLPTRKMPLRDGVYVTDKKEWAIKFAQYKAVWLQALPGIVAMGERDDDQSFGLLKIGKSKPIRTDPILLTLELPEDIARSLKVDREAGESIGAMWYPGTIAPRYIASIEPVPAKPLYQTATMLL